MTSKSASAIFGDGAAFNSRSRAASAADAAAEKPRMRPVPAGVLCALSQPAPAVARPSEITPIRQCFIFPSPSLPGPGGFGLERLRGGEAERADDARRKRPLRGVESRRDVVVRVPAGADALL